MSKYVLVERPNVVQAEFFHTPRNGSVEDIEAELEERARDGVPIKTVVRFYDVYGVLTEYAVRFDRIQKERAFALRDTAPRYGIVGLFRKMKRWLSPPAVSDMEKDVVTMAALSLGIAIKHTGSVAVENRDHSFRVAQPNELHELQEAARAATGVRLFIFQPNDLLADTNKAVVSVL